MSTLGRMSEFKTLVVGSLAFDVMFSIPHDFRQSIPVSNTGQIGHFNATYVASEKTEYPGGTAGNIAVWFGTAGGKASIFSAWGKDLEVKGYYAKLLTQGHQLKGCVGEFTAHCYNVSDPYHQQLVIWQPNHYEANKNQALADFYSPDEIAQFQQVIFSAGTPDSMVKHIVEFKTLNSQATVIFDPGQVSPFFTKEQFKTCVGYSDIVMGNKVEAEHFERYMHNFWPEAVTQIVTQGEHGLTYKVGRAGKLQSLPAVKVKTVLETTGAGDAFRAGLLSALSQSQTLEQGLVLGIKLASQAVQLPSPQPV